MHLRRPLRIAGIGRYLPDRVVSNSEVEDLCGLSSGWIKKRTGVCERRWANGETNSIMAAAAAREAVEDAGMQLDQIELIINASGTPEQAIPDGGPLVQQELGLGRSGIPCMSIHATCLSFLVALDISASLLVSKRYDRILIVSSDIGSAALNFDQPESAALIGDAAAAAVVTSPKDDEQSCIHVSSVATYGEGASLTAFRGGGCRKPPNSIDTLPQDNMFHMEGRALYKLVQRHLAAFLEDLRCGLSSGLGTIDLVIPHQPSGHALASLHRFSWPDSKVVKTLHLLGNCIAASIPLTLYEAVHTKRARRGDELLLIGTGAGVTLGGIILTF